MVTQDILPPPLPPPSSETTLEIEYLIRQKELLGRRIHFAHLRENQYGGQLNGKRISDYMDDTGSTVGVELILYMLLLSSDS